MDQYHCTSYKEEVIDTLNQLCARGYSNKILLSSDYCIYNDFAKPGSLGNEHNADFHVNMFNYQIKDILPKFKGSIKEFEKMTGENVLQVLDI